MGDHDIQWRSEKHPDHQRQFVQRERVGATPEVEMDDTRFGGPETHGQDEPWQLPGPVHSRQPREDQSRQAKRSGIDRENKNPNPKLP
ncbi:MAG: hypothetical protein AABM41_04935 [Chloroflexota bacterium]